MEELLTLTPHEDPDSSPYWDSLRQHAAKLQKCKKCGQFRFPPAPSCPYCGTMGGEWVPISGKGKVFSWIVVHRPIHPLLAADVPFVVAIIELDEGPRLAGRLIGYDLNRIKSDMRVKVRYDDHDTFTLLNFEPE